MLQSTIATSVLARRRRSYLFVAPDAMVDARGQGHTAPRMWAAGARVAAGSRVGPLAVVGEGCVVERGAVVIESVVQDGARVGARTSIERSVIVERRLARGRTHIVNAVDRRRLPGRRRQRHRQRHAACSQRRCSPTAP